LLAKFIEMTQRLKRSSYDGEQAPAEALHRFDLAGYVMESVSSSVFELSS